MVFVLTGWMFLEWVLYCGCVLYYKLLCLMRLSDFCRFLYIWTFLFKDTFQHFLKNVPKVWTIFVRTISLWFLKISFWGGGLLVLNGPPPQSRVSMSKFPSEGKIRKNCFGIFFIIFMKSLKMVIKWLRRVAFVGWDVSEASLADFGRSWQILLEPCLSAVNLIKK